MGLRAKSTKTRIETPQFSLMVFSRKEFKSKIHQNKDWNHIGIATQRRRTTFKSKIHQNKDWNVIVDVIW